MEERTVLPCLAATLKLILSDARTEQLVWIQLCQLQVEAYMP